MKRFYLIFLTLCLYLAMAADCRAVVTHPSTTDHLTISDLTVVPGSSETYYFTVSLVGSQIYTAYEADIHFPPGLDVAFTADGKPDVGIWTEEGSVYPYTENRFNHNKSYTHTMTSSYDVISKGTLRLSCLSLGKENLTAKSGVLFYVFVKASPYLKPGDATLQVDSLHLFTTDTLNAQQYNAASQTLTLKVDNHSTATVSVGASNKYGTCVLPFDADLPQGLRAFGASSRDKDNMLLLEEVSKMEAFTPYILYAPNGFTGTFSGEVPVEKYAETVNRGVLYGAVASQTRSEGYILQNKGDGAKFYWLNGTDFVIPEGRCWVDFPLYSGSKPYLGFSLPETTGIRPAAISRPAASPSAIYTLDGVRVDQMLPGHIYVVDGRKVLKLK